MTTQPQLPMFDPLAALLREHADTFRPDFAAWLALNRHVWDAFVREADAVWARGRRRYSARTIGEVLRHHAAVSEVAGEWKLNNCNFPDLARLYALTRPERAGFFEFRVMPGSERAA